VINRKQVALNMVICLGLYFIVGYLVILAIAMSEMGVEQGKNFIFDHPVASFLALFAGSEKNLVLQRAHQTFFTPWIQATFLIYALFITLKAMITVRKIPQKKEAHEYGSHGTSRWATKEEVEERLMKDKKGIVLGKIDDKELIYPVTGGQNRHVLVFGGSRSGKSKSIVTPNVFQIAKELGEHLVISDPKGEIYNLTSQTLKNLGYDIKVLNLLDTKKSHRYNPMAYVRTTKDAKSLANTIIKNTSDQNRKSNDDFWERAERSLISALILYIKETRPKKEHHLRNVLELGLSIGELEPEEADKLFKALPSDSPAKTEWRIFNQSEDKLRSSILTGFGVRFALWTEPDIVELTSKNDINLSELGDKNKKIALYIITPSQEDTFDVLPAMIIDQAFQEMYAKATSSPEGRLDTNVTMLLDELANIAPINNLPRKVSTMGGLGISAFLIFQSQWQFEDRYGKAVAAEIIDSCDTRLLLGTNDQGTREDFSKLLGETTILIENQSENKGEKSSSLGRSRSYINRKLMTPDEVGRLDFDELIILQRGHYPIKAKKNFISKEKLDRIPKTHWRNIPDHPSEKPKIISIEEVIESLSPKVTQQSETHEKTKEPSFIDNLIKG
jgi:type IV secretion system protein VirD4